MGARRGQRPREHPVVSHTPSGDIVHGCGCSQDATRRCGHGGSGGDLEDKVQIRLQNSLQTGPSRMRIGVRGLSLTPKRQLQGREGSFRGMAQG